MHFTCGMNATHHWASGCNYELCHFLAKEFPFLLRSLELVVEPWIEDLWEPLEATLEQLNSPSNARNTPLVPEQNKGIESSTATRAISDDAVMCPPVDKITEPTTSVNSEFTDPMGSSSTTDKFTEPVTSVNSEFTDPVSQPSTVGKITEPAKSVNSEFTNTTQAPTAIQPSVSNTVIATAPETAEGHDMELTDFERELKRVKFGSEPLSLPSIPPPSLSVKIEKVRMSNSVIDSLKMLSSADIIEWGGV